MEKYKTIEGQGKAWVTGIVNEIMLKFSKEKLAYMVNHNVDLVDMDRWQSLENLMGLELLYHEAMDIVNKLWEHDIEILEVPYNK